MHPEIADSERLTVFVFDSDRMKDDAVHWKAFMPNKHDGERSLYRIDGLDLPEVAELGQDLASERANQQLRGWGVFSALDVRNLGSGLRLRSDEPPDRHGVIDCWPAEKEDKRALALSLARAAAAVRFPFAA